ncbi:Oxysterol-binding protein [Backusella circina FSU 941]|nr:Oxysterol-binding protein [Backusella circina FSU 941]
MPHNTEANNDNNTEELAEGSRSILLAIASQLTKGTDLHRVTLPTFVLETRSMLERITDFMAHPELILPVSAIEDPIERFIGVLKWYLSGWHIKPSGVKKPYNPVLGEFFRCKYDFQDGSKGYYLAEQVSHHPPASAFFYTCPQHDVIICGDLKPKSRFYGNSVASLMKGTTNFIIPSRDHERYEIHMPNMYARGVLFGTMTLELGDASTIKCVTSDLVCELDFQTKGFFSGQWNSVTGKIKRLSTQEILYEVSGQWSSELYIKKYAGKSSGGLLSLRHSNSHASKEKPDLLVDVRDFTKYPLKVPEHQEEKESRELWCKVTESIRTRNLDAATDEKLRIEDSERAVRKEREEKKVPWNSRFFDTSGEYCVLKDMDKINYKDTEVACKTLDALYP